MGLQFAAVIPPQFLRRQPADSLDKTTFHLPHIDGRIQGLAAVVMQVDTQHPVFAVQCIDDYFGYRLTVGVIEKRPPTECRTVVIDAWRAVKTGRR